MQVMPAEHDPNVKSSEVVSEQEILDTLNNFSKREFENTE